MDGGKKVRKEKKKEWKNERMKRINKLWKEDMEDEKKGGNKKERLRDINKDTKLKGRTKKETFERNK